MTSSTFNKLDYGVQLKSAFNRSLSQLNDGVRWYSDNPNIQVFISFTVKITAPSLKKIKYSPYQQELWEIIKEKHDSGMCFHRI